MEIDAWLARFRRFWSAHVDALERHLDQLRASGSPQARRSTSPRSAQLADRMDELPTPKKGKKR
jgi:hypothetical protein